MLLTTPAQGNVELLRANRLLFPVLDRLALEKPTPLTAFYSCSILATLAGHLPRGLRLGPDQMQLLEEYKKEAPYFSAHDIAAVKGMAFVVEY